jgi:hypothetical protein
MMKLRSFLAFVGLAAAVAGAQMVQAPQAGAHATRSEAIESCTPPDTRETINLDSARAAGSLTPDQLAMLRSAVPAAANRLQGLRFKKG